MINLKIVQDADTYLKTNSKIYFLLKKIKDYEERLQYCRKISPGMLIEYEKKWQYLNRKYDQVNVYGIEFVSIGETIPRLFMYLKDRKKRDKKIFHIVLPTFFSYYTAGVVNKKIFDVFGKYIHFVTEENLDFWKYVIVMHSGKMNIEDFGLYDRRDVSYKFNIKVGRPVIRFSDEIEAYAKEKMRQMGIEGKFICLHAREAATKTKNFFSAYDDTSVVDADINTYGSACRYMQKSGYQVVRLGKDESKECLIEGIIDYANCFYDELMDFYLMANCKFLLGGMAGIIAIASFWGRPILQTNALSFCYGQESLPRTEYDMYVPKKFYSKRENRVLNLYETLNVSYKCDRYNRYFIEEGIEVIDNTEEEILNAIIEMDEKLNHTWIQTEDEIKCMDKYWKIIDLWKNEHKLAYISKKDGGQGREMFPKPICYSYLKENLYLLDMKELI